MPRITEVTLPAEQVQTLLEQVKEIPEVISVRVEKGISVQPPGDVVTVVTTDKSLPRFIQLLDQLGITRHPGSSVSTSSPMGLINQASAESIRNDASHFIWEEMDQEINKESSMTVSSMLGMAIAGAIAVIGLETNALHLVIGAMVIAPGFEPISRVALGLVSRSVSWKRGAADFSKGYLSMIAGAIIATILLRQLGYAPENTQETYLSKGALLSYWTSISITSLLVSAVAAAAGALLIIGQRAVLTAGVMIALALVPAATIFAMGISTANPSLLMTGLSRFVIEVAIVFLVSVLVFSCNRIWIDKRNMST